MSSGYHNIRLDERSSYLTTFACQFGKNRYKTLSFEASPTEDMFQHKINEIFKYLPNVFGIADDILVLPQIEKIMKECCHRCYKYADKVNLNLNKDKCHFSCTSVHFFGEVISRCGVQPDP